ncbi:ATP-binding protein [Kineococcus sp. R8]|uniref:ATP-binding protein n=1 Tax=Kineococcus siccus TaxID=2696567 RepID=UPI001411EADF|nr:ATP-binding protein [Kineococcus siccus]NAZ80253.1 ATP-binding protein [Kineococcus siccus]
MTTPVRKNDRIAILNALQAGVAPSRGLEHLQVGRGEEVSALTQDLGHVKDGGSAVRFIVGEYGAGKSFFLQVIRQAAQRAGFVTMQADITQDSRLYGTDGRVRALHSSLVASAGTKTQPEGGAMGEVLERFIDSCGVIARERGEDREDVIRERLVALEKYRGGYEFVDVILSYAEAVRQGDEERRSGVLRWLRGEYRIKSEARAAIGVNGMIGDADLFPSMRLMASLVRLAGYAGLLVELDEMGVLLRLNRVTRDANYEQVLTMVNSLLGGHADHLMMVFAGVPEFVTHPTTGLYSYGALRQRLSGNRFAGGDLQDNSGPVIELQQLVVEDLYVLLENVHRVFCSNGQRDPVDGELGEAISAFLEHAGAQLGGFTQLTPREATRSWLQFLSILVQNPRQAWRPLLGQVGVHEDTGPAVTDSFPLFSSSTAEVSDSNDGDLAGFRV